MGSFPPGRRRKVNRKQVLLFGIAVLLPALVILVFTLRLNSQESELRKRRAKEAREQKAADIGRRLEMRLEATEEELSAELSAGPDTEERATPVRPGLVAVGRVVDGELLMPWESRRRLKVRLSSNKRSDELILQAQRAEFSGNDLGRALSLYELALAAASSPSQEMAVRLHMGRVLSKSRNLEGARRLWIEVLGQPADLSDEYDIPFSLYAAERLSDAGRATAAVVIMLEGLVGRNGRLPPAALYLCRDVLALVGKKPQDSPGLKERVDGLAASVEDRLKTVSRLASLKDYVLGWISSRRSSSPSAASETWASFGDGPWIVGIRKDLLEGSRHLFVFKGPELLRAVLEEDGLAGTFPGACRLVGNPEAHALELQKPFEGLWLRFETTDTASWSKSVLPLPVLYWSILVLAVGFIMFGMYLLWRDVRRELALADMRSQFAANVSHELKTPLTAIRMFAEALAMGVKEKPEAQREYLGTIINETERLSRLLNNVLDFSRIEQGTRTYRLESLSLEPVMQAAVRAMAFPLNQKDFDLRVETETGIPRVRGDKDALEQAILNLLHNAMKYSGESRKILLRLRSRDGEARVEVVDFGIGISQKDVSRIFGRFFRAPGIEDQRIPGTGLGLAIVSHIARAHGGRVEVHSHPGEGSTFTIVLPLEES